MLSTDQNAALAMLEHFLNSEQNEVVLTGKPGTGKTYILKHLLKDKKAVTLTATTNKALECLKSSFNNSNNYNFSTIHNALGLIVMNNYINDTQKLVRRRTSNVTGILVIDECSMIDEELMLYIQELKNCKIIYVGDKNQLPPVKGRNPIFGRVPEVELSTVHRQANGSGIKIISDSFRDMIQVGKYNWDINSNKDVTVITDPDVASNIITDLYNSLEYLDNPNNIRTLCYTNKKVNNYNKFIRDNSKLFHGLLGNYLDSFPSVGETVVVNKPYLPTTSSIRLNTEDTFKVINREDVEVTIPTTGNPININAIKITTNEGPVLYLKNKDDIDLYRSIIKDLKSMSKNNKTHYRSLTTLKEMFIDIRPIHAQTVHKSQGSTYKNVFIDYKDLMKCRDLAIRARLFYVAISRASEHVYIYAE